MKRRRIAVCAAVFLLLTAAAYYGLCRYYENGFRLGTWINGVYCTGKSVKEVNDMLSARVPSELFVVKDIDGKTENISLKEISYSVNYKKPLSEIKEAQDPNLWISGFKNKFKSEIKPEIQYDTDNLEKALMSLSFVRAEQKYNNPTVSIEKTPQGYTLRDDKLKRLNVEKLAEGVRQALDAGEFSYCVEESCYENLPYTDREKEQYELWRKIQEFQDCGIIYDMGDRRIPIDAAVTSKWIAVTDAGEFELDERGELKTDKRGIEEFIDSLIAEYDTLGAERSFQATRGETVLVKGGTYGTKLNRAAEIKYLTEAFETKKREVHIPQYVSTGKVRGKDDIGDTYIEIDMTQQTMYYYEEGVLLLETPVVTGNTGRRMGTPEGTCYVYNKQRNRVLRGENYASFVNYWVPVKGNIGIHDASWRSDYGGEIYKTNGSHGCINTPYDVMAKLYDRVEIGTPVILFY